MGSLAMRGFGVGVPILVTLLSLPVCAQDKPEKPVPRKVQKAIERFEQVFSNPRSSEERKVQCIQWIQRYVHPRIALTLAPYLTQESLAVRVQAARVLGDFKKISGIDEAFLLACRHEANLGGEWAAVRITMLQLLGQRRAVKAVAVIDENISNENAWIAKAAMEASMKLCQKSSVDALIKEYRTLSGDEGLKKLDADPLAEVNHTMKFTPEEVVKHYDHARPADKSRRDLLENVVRKALRTITNQRWVSADQWERWWGKVRSSFRIPRR